MTPPMYRLHSADAIPEPGHELTLSGDEGRHAVTVARTRAGETILLGDGRGTVARCEVTDVQGRDTLTARVVRRTETSRPNPPVTLVQALAKGDRGELSVELATEAGVDTIVPWQSEHCVVRWDEGGKDAKDSKDGKKSKSAKDSKAVKGVAKWTATVEAAAKQSRRAWVPEVTDLASTAEVCELIEQVTKAGGVAAILHESARLSIRDLPLERAEHIILVVGPEGGLSQDELDKLEDAGGRASLLSPTVLRTSTAAAVALGAVGVLTPRWGQSNGRDSG